MVTGSLRFSNQRADVQAGVRRLDEVQPLLGRPTGLRRLVTGFPAA
jgi:hypothetical protein